MAYDNEFGGIEGDVVRKSCKVGFFVRKQMAQGFSRACSFDPSFEQLLPYALHWNTIVEEEDFREPPLDRAQFETFFDQDGRLGDEQRFRKAVFRGKSQRGSLFLDRCNVIQGLR